MSQTLPSQTAGPRLLPHLAVRYDLRAPSFGASSSALVAAALEQVAYLERHGFERVQVSEHHGSPDGYCPSPFVVASALAARTRRMRIRLSALVLPLHDIVRVAEDAVMLDVVSGGRAEITAVAGYARDEFAMLGRSFADRGRRLRDGVRVLKRVWNGEEFEFEGRTVRVRPLPVQVGGPPVLLGGGSVTSARRAAEAGDGFDPTDPALIEVYRKECARLGRDPGDCRPKVGPFFVHVAEDPERLRALLAPHVRHEMIEYSRLSAPAAPVGGTPEITEEQVWAVGSHRVVTPGECVELLRSLDPQGTFVLHPLSGGLSPELAQESLELFVTKVLPAASGERRS